MSVSTDRHVRLIVTTNSLWAFDFTNMEFQRHPRHEDSEGTTWVPYEQTNWTTFTSFHQVPCPDEDGPLAGRVRFTVYLSDTPYDWITSTFDPKEQ